MAGNTKSHPITIDLNQFKLHLEVKNRIELTLHFNSPSRRFYLSVIALLVNEMKRQGKITSIPLKGHHDLLALLNETIGGSAGSSETVTLLSRIYSKWQHALPNLEEAPLFTVLGRKKGYDEGTGKTYPLTEAEKDCWANLFEYKGSHENVRLKFAVDKIGATLDDVVIVFEDSLNGDAWQKFISSLKEKMAVPIPDKRSKGERKLVTVLFAKVANFTSMAEKFGPDEVYQIMDGFFRVLMDEIDKYEGTISQFTGDGVMALFGAPVAHEDHVQRACYAALSVQNTMADYGKKLKKEFEIDFKIRIGLNTGPVVAGSIGDDLRMYYAAIGDTIDLASRMETTAKPGTILSSGHTYELVRDYFKFESFGKVQVKGEEEPQEAYELIRTSDVKTKIEAAAVAGLTKFVGRRR